MPPIPPFDQSQPPNSPYKATALIIIAIMISASGLLAAATTYGNANTEGQHHHPGPDIDAIAATLKLTEEQAAQLALTLTSHHERRRASHQTLRQQHKDALDHDLTSFLSETQRSALHHILRKHKPHRACHRQGHAHSHPA